MRIKWKLISVRLEIVLILTQERCTLCGQCTIGSKIVFDAPDGTPQWRWFYGIPFWSVWRWCLCWCKIGLGFVTNVPYAQKSFWTHPMVLLGYKAQVEARFSLFGYSANLNARKVHTLQWEYHGLENHFRWPDGAPQWCGSYGISFRLIWRWHWYRCEIGAGFAPNVPYTHKSFWTHPMVLLGYEAQVEAHFGLFGDSANLDTRKVHGFRWMYDGLENRFWRTRWNSSVTWVLWNLVLVTMDSVFVSEQDRCRVAPNVPYAQKSFWMRPMALLGYETQVDARSGPLEESANLDAR
jgi:hypothetical protein